MERFVDVVLPSAPKRYYATNAKDEEEERGRDIRNERQRRRIIQRSSVVCAEIATEPIGLRIHLS